MQLKFHGIKEFQKALSKLPENMQRQAYRKGITEGAKIARDAAKQNAQAVKDTGALARSIGFKVSRDRRSAKIGARTGFKREVKDGNRKTKSGFIDPFYYAHLVELGTRIRVTKDGKNRGAMKATPFLQPAVDNNRERIMSAISKGIRDGMTQAIARARQRQQRRRR